MHQKVEELNLAVSYSPYDKTRKDKNHRGNFVLSRPLGDNKYHTYFVVETLRETIKIYFVDGHKTPVYVCTEKIEYSSVGKRSIHIITEDVSKVIKKTFRAAIVNNKVVAQFTNKEGKWVCKDFEMTTIPNHA
jgi:hypothetical protein